MDQNTIQGKLYEIFDRYAEKTAIEYGDRIITYKELDEKSNCIANWLIAKHISKGSFIGVLMYDRAAIIISAISILKTGCVFVPLDTGYPKKKLDTMLRTSDTALVLTDSPNFGELGKLYTDDGKNVEIAEINDSFYKNREAEYENPAELEYTPDDKIYIYFTSGSTGTPKAILGRNGSLLHFINWETGEFGINNETRVSQLTSQCHDPYLRDVFVPLCAGGTVCIPKEKATILEPRSLINWIEASGVNLIHCTPSLFNVFNSDILTADKFEHLKYILLAGEKVNPGRLAKWYGIFKDRIQLINLYGPTETTLAKLFYPIKPSDIEKKNIPIGKPIKGSKIVIVDESMKICPQGIMGEIIIRTPYRTHGYYKNAQLNSEKFVQNPFGQTPEDIVYKTGDLGRILPDGNVEFLGRADKQVKIRGFRIELGEIENVLLGHEKVKEAIVTDRESETGNRYLCAYIVKEEGQTAGSPDEKGALSAELKEYLSQRLPDYMIPLYFTMLEKMPLTPNGKLDYRALPEPDKTVDEKYTAPRNETERELEKIWCDILEIDRIGINRSFLHAGGHSLNMMTLIARVNQRFNVDLPFKDVFENPTIERIAELIEKNEKNIFQTISRVEAKEYYEVSPAQRRLFILNSMEGMNTAYNIHGAVLIEGRLDRHRLESSFSRLIERQESLRTSFQVIDGEPVQKIHAESELEISYIEALQQDIDELMQGFIKPFELNKLPLFRIGLIKLSEDRHVLIYDIHHIISDAVSMNILVREFARLYAGEELPEPVIRYRDYAAWKNELFSKNLIREQEDYWMGVFSDEIPVLKMPTDYRRPAVQSYEGNKIEFTLNSEVTKRLKAICSSSGATMYMVLFAAYNVLLHKYTGQSDIIVGLPIAGRQHDSLENVIGVFINTIIMRNRPTADKTFEKFLEEVRSNSLDAYQNQDYPFEELVEKLNLPRDLSRNPLFDTMFELHTGFEQELEINGLKFSPCKFTDSVAKFDIRLQGIEKEDEIDFELEYCTKLFKKSTMERFVTHFTNILEEVSCNTGIRVCDIKMLSEEERKQILADFNNTVKEFPEDMTVFELFEEQADRYPDRIAIKYGNEELTYDELNSRANQLARFLQKNGIQNESLAVIMMERSVSMVVSILAVWKAGGAYIPVDVNYPVQRVGQIIEDSGSRLILTRSEYISEEIEEKLAVKVVRLDECRSSLEAEDSRNLNLKPSTGSLAYVIYTSGSTGKPKGAMVEHIGMMNHMQAKTNDLKLDESCIIAQNASHCFDISVWQFFTALINGGKTVIFPNELTLNPEEFISSVISEGITILEVVPSFLAVALDYLETHYRELKMLDYILVTGETVKRSLVKKWFEMYAGIKMVNAYGPTEASDDITHYIMDKTPDMLNIPIGKPLQNFSIYIVDNSMKLCPVGVTGEICVAGKGVGRGYLNNPQKTGEVFIEDPFAGKPGVRLYKTGDLARWLPDGNIEFLGRKDYQIKIRGFRIELGEIESRLVAHPAVKEAVVIDRQDKNGGKYLCAYIVHDEELKVSELKEYLSGTLPGYMVPSYFVRLQKLPLNPNGKVNRKALPAHTMDSEMKYQAPVTQTQKLLAEIWKDVLGAERVGINDNFFELGGHSLKAIKLLSKLESAGISLKINDIFQLQDLGSIAEYIDSMAESNNLIDTVEEAERKILDRFECENRLVKYDVAGKEYFVLYIFEPHAEIVNDVVNFIKDNMSPKICPHYIRAVRDGKTVTGQETNLDERGFTALMGLKTRNTETALQNMIERLDSEEKQFQELVLAKGHAAKYPVAPVQRYSLEHNESTGIIIRLEEYLDTEILKKVLTDIIKTHGLLRSTLFEENGNLLWNEYNAPDDITIPEIDLSAYGEAGRNAVLRKIMDKYYYKDYLKFGKLYYRVLLVKINLREHLLMLPFSHTIFDAGTSEILKRSISSGYMAQRFGRVSAKEDTVAYSEYVEQVTGGPQDITEEQLIETLELDQYEACSHKLGKAVSSFEKGATKAEAEINFDSSNFQEDRVWEISFALAATFCRKYLGITRIPVWTMSYGRYYAGKAYFNTVGEFIDLVPILADTRQNDIGAIAKHAQDKLKIISKNNINFANLLYNEAMAQSYSKVHDYLKRELSTESVSFNFQGKLKADELELDMSLKHKKDNLANNLQNPKNIVFTVSYTPKSINITLNLPFKDSRKKLNRLLEECIDEVTACAGIF